MRNIRITNNPTTATPRHNDLYVISSYRKNPPDQIPKADYYIDERMMWGSRQRGMRFVLRSSPIKNKQHKYIRQFYIRIVDESVRQLIEAIDYDSLAYHSTGGYFVLSSLEIHKTITEKLDKSVLDVV